MLQGFHRNIPWWFLLGFVLLAQLVGLSAALNFFFAAMILTPVPLQGETVTQILRTPSREVLLVPSLISMAWVVLVPMFLDFTYWPLVCYLGFILVPLLLAVLPKVFELYSMKRYLINTLQICASLHVGNHTKDVTTARKTYVHVYRTLAITAFVIHVIELIGIFSKTAPPRRTVRHNYLWIAQRSELTLWEQLQTTLGRIIGSLSDDPIITGTMWDILLTGASLSIWAVLRNIHVASILNVLGFPIQQLQETLGNSSKLLTTSSKSDPETPRKRGRKKKDATADNADGAYVPSSAVSSQVKALEPLALYEDERERSTEAGAIAWVLFFFTGLGTALSAILGAGLSGG
jgi:hypothetical protein